MRVLILGKSGQLAHALMHTLPQGIQATCAGRDDVDITNTESVNTLIKQYAPSVVINAAAYTAVDKAEADRDAAWAVNATGVEHIALACKTHNVRLLHVSTDFVFGSQSAVTLHGIAPLLPLSTLAPMSVYGESKLAGEQVIANVLPNNSVVVRTAWVYSPYGANFVKTMLNLMATKPELGVIYDQIGTPTNAFGLAKWLWAVANKPHVTGTHHWTDAGVASWYDFAVAIQELALQKGLLQQTIPIKPISTAQYPTPAKRPSYSVLDKTSAEAAAGLQAKHWRSELSHVLDWLAGAIS